MKTERKLLLADGQPHDKGTVYICGFLDPRPTQDVNKATNYHGCFATRWIPKMIVHFRGYPDFRFRKLIQLSGFIGVSPAAINREESNQEI